MGYNTVMSDVQLVGAGANYDLQPPLNQDWRLIHVGSDIRVGVAPNTIPDVDVSLFDGVNQGNFLTGANTRGWYRRQNICISNANYVRALNNGAQANVSFSCELIQYFGTGLSVVMSDVQNVGAAAVLDVQPPINQDWYVYDFGSDQWLGAAPNAVPEMEVEIFDGVNVARFLDSTEIRQWNSEMKLPINNANYLRLTNADGVNAADLCWSAELARISGTGMTIVRTDVLVAGAGANVDFQPPAGEEWAIRMIGASVWAGISPNQYPDITASFWDGVNASTLEIATDLAFQQHSMDIRVDNVNYLRCLDTGGAGLNVGIAAELTQMYA